jgi:hypothetical protein
MPLSPYFKARQAFFRRPQREALFTNFHEKEENDEFTNPYFGSGQAPRARITRSDEASILLEV